MRLQISKLVATIICFVATIPCFGSNPWMEDYTYIGSYNTRYGYCEVYGTANDEGYGVCIEIPDGLDKHNKFILIRDYELSEFVNSLTQLKDKFSKWDAVAKQNNVSDYHKNLDINCIDVYGLSTPDSKEGAGLWNCSYDKDLSMFMVYDYGSSSVWLEFFGQCEEGEAKGKNAFFTLHFKSVGGLGELIRTVNPENVRSKLGLNGGNARKRNYDSLFN